MDAAGYPYRLQSTDVALPTRTLAVGEAWDPMASNRSCRRGTPTPAAETILLVRTGTQWHTAYVEVFLRSSRDYQIRIDREHTDLAAPGNVRSSAVACMARWPALCQTCGLTPEHRTHTCLTEVDNKEPRRTKAVGVSYLCQRMVPRTRSDSRRATADRELPEATGPGPPNHRGDVA